jgi:hypothetical protein
MCNTSACGLSLVPLLPLLELVAVVVECHCMLVHEQYHLSYAVYKVYKIGASQCYPCISTRLVLASANSGI